jgi:hypothetical protein
VDYINIDAIILVLTILRGPAYNGVFGKAKKMWEVAINPGNFPFLVGMVSAGLLIGSIPVTGNFN